MAKAGESKALVIVESPSKAKTIGKFLGKKYKVVASVGHVRDLPKSKLGIEIDNNFEPAYINIRGKGDVIRELKKEAKTADKIYLATDPDREGEAISWHIAYLLGLNEAEKNRIVFNEITKEAIRNAVGNPRPIDLNLVDAQQARRILDRLVGYRISPLLWRKIRRGLSAGRVQSAALKIICDREKEIRAFVPEEFWNIAVTLTKKEGDRRAFSAKLIEKDGGKLTVRDGQTAETILRELSAGNYAVGKVEKKERIRRPYPPFTTSSMQQDASVKLGFFTKRIMSVAQQLYEGVEVKGRGTIGLISYIRTDSVRISAEADAMAKAYIKENFSEDYLGNNRYANKKKDVQDAHEAIRPSYVNLRPDDIRDSLSPDQYKLYKLIWSRFVASRMAPAVFDAVSADVVNGAYTFRATGSKLKFDGFLSVYRTGQEDGDDRMLPELTEGEALDHAEISSEQSFTQPPPRFTEAGLVKELEERDIGRPSTYVSIIAALIERKYVLRIKKTLQPTDLGFVVTDLMEKYFNEIVDAGFTAAMEDRLDDIETKGIDWHGVVGNFYEVLREELTIADREIEKVELQDEMTDEVCALCGKPMVIKHGRFGEFMACSGYPECKNTKPIVTKTDIKCPLCGADIVARKSRKGRVFYGCSGYPNCRQIYWNKPVNRQCPECGALLTEKKTKTGNFVCSNSDCGYKE
ncbi:MAG: type I DNA topoisomerase [Clostridiales Family XIII bacterium]|jgi:DNA topoisomerase-1|nr:type I DNA topoisomerase [Clostridiales Family XIII bacterium]